MHQIIFLFGATNASAGAHRGITSAMFGDHDSSAAIGLYKARGTFNSRTAVQSGDVIGNVFPIARAPDGSDSSAARFGWQVNGAPSGSVVLTDFILDVPNNTGTRKNALRVFASGGRVGIGFDHWTTAITAETGLHLVD